MRDAPNFASLADDLETDWQAIARPEQLPPPGDWLGWAIIAGRGFGKTRSGAEWVQSIVENGQACRIALVAATAADARDVMIEGESGILAVSPAWNTPVYEPSKRRLTWPNGAIATTYSADEPRQLRGPQHDAAWADELAAWADPEATWDQLAFTLRLGDRPRKLVTTTPRPIKLIKDIIADPDFVITRGKTSDNAGNLAPSFLKSVVARYAGTRLGRQELDAEVLEDIEGALWSRAVIERLRITVAARPALRRIVVAIDPATTSHEGSDETGIIVAALGDDGHGYVLEDASGRFAPTEWARKAVTLFHRWGADRIIAEANQGGEMVEATVRMVDPNVAYKAVHASRGKITRAEPVSALYEQGRVHHVGTFPTLEDQLTTYEPGARKSPDRMDGLVWAFTELMVGQQSTGIIGFYQEAAASLAALPAPGPDYGWTLGATSSGATVRFLVPPGVSTVSLLSGESLSPDRDGVVTCRASDAVALRIAGWREAPITIEGEIAP